MLKKYRAGKYLLHNHSSMEQELGLREDHVIIDRHVYKALLADIQEEFLLNSKEDKILEEKDYFPLKINKFHIIRDLNEVKDDMPEGLYFFNSKIPASFISPLKRWLSDVLNSNLELHGAYLSNSNFSKKYDYSLCNLPPTFSSFWDMPMGLSHYLMSKGINTIRLYEGRIEVYNDQIRCRDTFREYHSKNTFRGYPSKNTFRVIMNLLNIITRNSGISSELIEYCNYLNSHALIYSFDLDTEEITICFAPGATSYTLSLWDLGSNLNYLTHLKTLLVEG